MVLNLSPVLVRPLVPVEENRTEKSVSVTRVLGRNRLASPGERPWGPTRLLQREGASDRIQEPYQGSR